MRKRLLAREGVESKAPGRYPDAVLAALRAACDRSPGQRVAQVIGNALGPDPFYIEDADAVLLFQEYPPASDASSENEPRA